MFAITLAGWCIDLHEIFRIYKNITGSNLVIILFRTTWGFPEGLKPQSFLEAKYLTFSTISMYVVPIKSQILNKQPLVKLDSSPSNVWFRDVAHRKHDILMYFDHTRPSWFNKSESCLSNTTFRSIV